MKFLTLITFIWCAHALAMDECPSVWVYRAYSTCANAANGLDTSKPASSSVTIGLWSAWMMGGADQQKVCSDMRDKINRQNETQHSLASLTSATPVQEITKQHLLVTKYKYQCEFEIKKYPFKVAVNSACGLQDMYTYKIGGELKDIPGQGTCLSCDNMVSGTPEQVVDCLHNNIENIITPKAIELRDSDINEVVAQVKKLLALSQHIPITNLQSDAQLTFFSDFIEHAGKSLDRVPQDQPEENHRGDLEKPQMLQK